MRWLLDEMLPDAAAEVLRRLGHNAVSVRSIGLRQAPDAQVYATAVAEHRVLVTEDRAGFAPLAKEDLDEGRPSVPIVIVHRDSFGRQGALAQHLATALHRWALENPEPWPGPQFLTRQNQE